MNAPDKMIVSASRRNWLKAAGALAGFSLIAGPSGLVMAADAVKYGGDNMPGGVVDDALVFLAIGADGIVTIIVHRSEMGQGIRTSLPMVAADELGADWARVKVQQAPADEAPNPNAPPLDQEALARLLQLLRTSDLAASACFNLLAPQLRPRLGPAVFAATEAQVDGLAFDAAITALQGLAEPAVQPGV